ncbi:MAG: hypothetical protein ACLRFK_01520 [Alphaproteobacteria bacterium]
MSGIFKLFGMSVLTMGACLLACNADAATGRADYTNVRTTTVGGVTGTTTARMPGMPTLPMIAVGNISTNIPSDNTGNGSGNNGGGSGNNGGGNNDCPDGGVKDSAYTVDNCMRDVLACVNGGALPNGLNDMFNEDLRASIINGMGLCYTQVDKCLTDVRRNCKRVYGTRADVWIDFNSRKVQPEYYSFVLYNTGLTPTQAENTCKLLDTNAYGKSFAAVNSNGDVTGEYGQSITAYNGHNGNKTNPLGANLNTNGQYDDKRGHYARWDAAKAQCLVRVAAYNKDKLITNEWLFGAIGDEQPAEVWKVAGETFTCNKDLFGFSLMKDTATVALVGVGGGAVTGAAVGASVGAGIADKKMSSCKDKKYRDALLVKIKNSKGKMDILENFLNYGKTSSNGQAATTFNQTTTELTEDICNQLIQLPDIYAEYDAEVTKCEKAEGVIASPNFEIRCQITSTYTVNKCVEDKLKDKKDDLKKVADKIGVVVEEDDIVATLANHVVLCMDKDAAKSTDELTVYTLKKDCDVGLTILTIAGHGSINLGNCVFKGLDLSKLSLDRNIACDQDNLCRPYTKIREELDSLKSVLDVIELRPAEARATTIGKATGIGTAIGVGAGGLATAITALVESDNINCRVGDDLGRVGFNKSYSIDSLKDMYVKWKLNLPDAQVMGASSAVNDYTTWTDACKEYSTNETLCKDAQFYYKNASGVLEWVYSACTWDTQTNGSTSCKPNETLIKTYGVPTVPSFPNIPSFPNAIK